MNRPHTSESKIKDLRRPDRRTAMKVLVKKSFKFVDVLWATYITRNSISLRYKYSFVHMCIQAYRTSDLEDNVITGDDDLEDWLTDGMLPTLDPSDDMDQEVHASDDEDFDSEN